MQIFMANSQTIRKLGEESSERLSSRSLMDRLRAEIKEAAEAGRSKVATFYPLQVRQNSKDIPPLTSSEELHYLNVHLAEIFARPTVTSHRPLVGRLIVAFKQRLIRYLWDAVFGQYFHRQEAFYQNLVRYLNFSSQAVDQKFGQIFWDLVRKIDVDVQGVNDRTQELVSGLDATFRTFEGNISGRLGQCAHELTVFGGQIEGLRAQVATVENVARGLERTLALLSPRESQPMPPTGSTAEASSGRALDVEYLLLENRFRGSEEEIKISVKDYLPLLQGLPGPVLDIGCGRGELLELLRELKIESRGIDLDAAMIARCAEKGLPVEEADLFAYLEKLPDDSLGGVIATQVIEHITHKQLDTMLGLLRKKVRSGGVIILETINPQSVTALARNFFRDPTHVFPVHPETLRFTMEMRGFKTAEILYRSPYPAGAILRPIEYSAELPGRWIGVLQQINDNMQRLNDLLFGHQDYAVIARQ